VLLLFHSGSTVEVAQSILTGFIWSACILAMIAWIMPTPSDLRLGDEQYFNANEIGNLCAFGIFFAQYLTRCKNGQWRLAKWLLVITLIRSLSKTTLAAFVVSQVSLLILDKTMSRRMKLLLVFAAFLLVLVFWGLFEAYYDFYTTTGNQAETLTGRTAIWLYVLSAVPDHPWTLWIGHGFDSWWKTVPPFAGGLFEARHAENELLQQLYAYGIAGVLLLAGIYGSLFRELKRLKAGPAQVMFLSMLIFIVVRGLAEADSFDLLLPLWSIVLISVLAGYEGRAGLYSGLE
jgi:O-antigen ligase